MNRIFALALAVLLDGAALRAVAEPPPGVPPLAALPVCHAPDSAQEKADTATTTAALQGFAQGGYAQVELRAADLQQVLQHPPAGMKAVELCGDSVVVRTSLPDFLLYSAVYASQLHGQDRIKRVVFIPSPVPVASLLLGSLDNEHHDYAAAYRALEVGLSVAPNNAELVTEAASALSQMNRYPEALALCDGPLANSAMLDVRNHARLLRSRGTALEGERRWDEAAAAYQESLTLDAGNFVALNELRYIAQQRAGAPPVPAQLTRSVTPRTTLNP